MKFNFCTILKKIMLLASLFSLISFCALSKGEDEKYKGVWLRPTDSISSATIQLDNIKKAGFNAVYIETFYHGHTIFPSKFVPIRPEMKGKDFLKFYVDECHKRGLKCHAWIEAFYWGVDTQKYPQFPKSTLLEKHPEWKTKLRDGRDTNFSESAHIFVEPAHPEVRKFLVDFIKEILVTYKVDGINLDYIRYAAGAHDSGFSDYARKEYKKLTDIDPIDIEPDINNAQWKRWVEYKEEQVLATVRDIKKIKDSVRKDAILSAAIFYGYKEGRYKEPTCQNWMQMIAEGSLDVVIPMAYSENLNIIEQELLSVKEEIQRSKQKIDLLPVLAVQKKSKDAYSGTYHPSIKEQLKVINYLGLNGFSVFCYDWIADSNEGFDLLK